MNQPLDLVGIAASKESDDIFVAEYLRQVILRIDSRGIKTIFAGFEGIPFFFLESFLVVDESLELQDMLTVWVQKQNLMLHVNLAFLNSTTLLCVQTTAIR